MIIKVINKNKNKLRNIILITIFTLFTLFGFFISYDYINDEMIKRVKLERQKISQKKQELKLKEEKEKKKKEFEQKILDEVEKVIWLFNISPNKIKVKIVDGYIVYTVPKNLNLDFLNIRYLNNVKIINDMSEDFLYIFVNLNVFNEVKYNKEQKIKKENYNQKIITKEKRLKNKKQNIIKIEEGINSIQKS